MAVPPLPIGHKLQEYRIQSLLGVGGFGLTYLALDENLRLKVALKEYLPGEIALRTGDNSVAPSSAETAESFGAGKRRFLDESRALASFRHPNIVRVMRFFEANGSAYMVMEFVAGAALTDWIRPLRPLPEAHVRALVMPLLDGLEVVHKAGYAHRDVKPGNIYIRREDDAPVLLDFGSARMQASELTAIVSPGYAPLEQYHAQGKQGPWSDLYALGGVLYWIVTGNRPHEAVARVPKDTMPTALAAGDRDLYGTELLAAIDWALAPSAADRPQSVGEWREALLGMRTPMALAKINENAFAKTQLVHRYQEEFAKTLVMPRYQGTPPPAQPTPPVFDPVLLEKLETDLAHHLGPIAKVVVRNAVRKARVQAELIPLLAAEISDPKERAGFERRFSGASQPSSAPEASVPANPPTARVASRFPLEVLERAERRVSDYMGAVSRVVVKRAAMKARDESELYRLIAEEIESPDDKKAFLRRASVPRKP